jgi:hypothetical protein
MITKLQYVNAVDSKNRHYVRRVRSSGSVPALCNELVVLAAISGKIAVNAQLNEL